MVLTAGEATSSAVNTRFIVLLDPEDIGRKPFEEEFQVRVPLTFTSGVTDAETKANLVASYTSLSVN